MSAVVVSIAGRTYRMSCEDGEEARIEELARYVDDKIVSMRENFAEIGEQRIVVMAALAIADEASDARAKAQTMERNAAALGAELEAMRKENAARVARATEAIEDAARRLEKLEDELQTAAAAGDEGL